MFKKNILVKIFVIFVVLFSWLNTVIAEVPDMNCFWLPGCEQEEITDISEWSSDENVWIELVSNIIWQIIQFTAVIAIIALILSGIMYLLSGWEEEKTKKAKNWIIWSLVWVILSISAWWIINILNAIKIN